METITKLNDTSIIERICKAGYEAYLVGGAVRDLFLDQEPLDRDIVTNALPDDLIDIFSDRHIDTVGKSFLVTLIDGYDVATYRKDIYSISGGCVPERVKHIKDDLGRRDLTINALAYCPYTGDLIDYFDGIADLNNGVIRFVGDPTERIIEDPVRMIRACRFTTRLTSPDGSPAKLDSRSFTAICNNKELIKSVPSERIKIEFDKVLKTADKPSVFIKNLYDTGLLELLIPELAKCFYFTGGNHHTEDLHDHLLIATDSLSKEKPLLRLAALLHDIGKPEVYDKEKGSFLKHELIGSDIAHKVLKRLKYSTKEISYVTGIIKLHMLDVSTNIKPKSIRRYLKKCYDNQIPCEDLLLHKFADDIANVSKESFTEVDILVISKVFKTTAESGCPICIKDLDIDGRDVIELGYKGKYIGIVLEHLLKCCIGDPESNKKERLVKIAIGSKKDLLK